MKFLMICLIPVLSFSLILAQDIKTEANEVKEADCKIDRLFDQIMLTFPQEIKMKIDSAGSQKSVPEFQKKLKHQENALKVSEQQQKKIDKLSPELRKQVEKTIEDIEKRRNERALQFREYKQK